MTPKTCRGTAASALDSRAKGTWFDIWTGHIIIITIIIIIIIIQLLTYVEVDIECY